MAKRGVKIVAPAIYALLALDSTNKTIIPSTYATAAKAAGLDIITWSLERSGFLNKGMYTFLEYEGRMHGLIRSFAGGDYYYTSVAPVINNDGDMYTVVDALVNKVGVKKIFSDWPATVTYFANCFGLS